MFRGETAVELTTRLDEAAFRHKVEDALSPLGRVRVEDRGRMTVTPSVPLGSTLTEVVLDGTVRPTGDGGYDVAVRYNCQPTVACWVLAVVSGLFTAGIGMGLVLVPLMDKKQVEKRVRLALAQLEDVADDRPG